MRDGESFSTRWFTPEYELELCGHGILATGYVIFNKLEPTLQKISLHFGNGFITVKRNNEFITLDFPAKTIKISPSLPLLAQGLKKIPKEIYHYNTERCFAVFDSEAEIQQLKPDMDILKKLEYRSIIVTAPGVTCDFVSRVFYPNKSMTEDAVTGSSHCFLVPYWSTRLNKKQFQSRQLSHRGGELACELKGARVFISGRAVLYMQGTLVI